MANIFFFGDSITFGAWDNEGGWANRIKKEVHKKIVSSNFTYYHHIYQLGIPGDNTTTLLQRFEQEIKTRLADEEDNSTVIILAIGINDSQVYKDFSKGNRVQYEDFQNNLQHLLQIAKKYTSRITFVGLTPVDESKVDPIPWTPEKSYTNATIAKYNDELKKFCTTNNLPFIDIFADWIGGNYKNFLIDGLHPNTDGHEKIYRKVKGELEKIKIL